ncbi:hypothetical protein [Microcoleus sp.]|uniref:hypothetical protein n=1 Tax=Microcoleus sp. TaxID=44472 RepID=UPI0035946051
MKLGCAGSIALTINIPDKYWVAMAMGPVELRHKKILSSRDFLAKHLNFALRFVVWTLVRIQEGLAFRTIEPVLYQFHKVALDITPPTPPAISGGLRLHP